MATGYARYDDGRRSRPPAAPSSLPPAPASRAPAGFRSYADNPSGSAGSYLQQYRSTVQSGVAVDNSNCLRSESRLVPAETTTSATGATRDYLLGSPVQRLSPPSYGIKREDAVTSVRVSCASNTGRLPGPTTAHKADPAFLAPMPVAPRVGLSAARTLPAIESAPQHVSLWSRSSLDEESRFTSQRGVAGAVPAPAASDPATSLSLLRKKLGSAASSRGEQSAVASTDLRDGVVRSVNGPVPVAANPSRFPVRPADYAVTAGGRYTSGALPQESRGREYGSGAGDDLAKATYTDPGTASPPPRRSSSRSAVRRVSSAIGSMLSKVASGLGSLGGRSSANASEETFRVDPRQRSQPPALLGGSSGGRWNGDDIYDEPAARDIPRAPAAARSTSRQPSSGRGGAPAAAAAVVRPAADSDSDSGSGSGGSEYYTAKRSSRAAPPAPPASSRDSAVNVKRRSGPPRGLVGLANLGNTCFMNSCLQCLSNVPPLTEYFLAGLGGATSRSTARFHINRSATTRTKGEVATAYAELVGRLWADGGGGGVERPSRIKQVVGAVASRFLGYDQQDAQEFLVFLLDALADDTNRVTLAVPYRELTEAPASTPDAAVSEDWWRYYGSRCDSAVRDLFTGQLRSTVACGSCGGVSRAFDPFTALALPIPRGAQAAGDGDGDGGGGAAGCSLSDCLRAFVRPETIGGDDAHYCGRCKAHRTVTKTFSLFRLPPVLVLHLKRFTFSSFRRTKLTAPVRFPVRDLDMRPFLAPTAAPLLAGASSPTSLLYDCVAVSNHAGSLGGGHYTADGLNCDDGGWYHFNDSHVSPTSASRLSASAAYLLFYVRKDCLA